MEELYSVGGWALKRLSRRLRGVSLSGHLRKLPRHNPDCCVLGDSEVVLDDLQVCLPSVALCDHFIFTLHMVHSLRNRLPEHNKLSLLKMRLCNYSQELENQESISFEGSSLLIHVTAFSADFWYRNLESDRSIQFSQVTFLMLELVWVSMCPWISLLILSLWLY